MAGRFRIVASALALAAGVAACGGGGDEDAVRSAIDDLVSATEERDSDRLCARLSSAALGGLTPEQCASQLEISFGATGIDTDVPSYEITDVTVDGDTATATVVSEGEEASVAFVNEGGEWKATENDLGG